MRTYVWATLIAIGGIARKPITNLRCMRDWGRKTWKNIMRSKITFLDQYNPDEQAITSQVLAAGGWDNYKGQLFYFNPEVDDYPLIEADSVWEDF